MLQILIYISNLRFSRKSTHINKPETGTATWEEFDSGLRVQHSEHEREYTPDVFDSFKVLDWNAETDALGDEVGEYRDVKMSSMSIAYLISTGYIGIASSLSNSYPFILSPLVRII